MFKHLFPQALLAVYGWLLVKVMILREVPLIRLGHLMFNFGGVDANGNANLVPFKTILPYLLGKGGVVIGVFEIVGNIGLLVPFGLLLALAFPSMTRKASFVVALATGFTIEGMQVILHTGIFDIDDVILNGLGVVLGFWICRVFQKN